MFRLLRPFLVHFFLLGALPAQPQTQHSLGLGTGAVIAGAGLGTLALSRFVIKEKPLDTLIIFDQKKIPGIDRIALDRWSVQAHRTSDVLLTSSVIISFGAGILNQNGQDLEVPVALILESLLVNSGFTTLMKNWIARPRPYTYGFRVPPGQRPASGNLVSFWSGHTSTAASATIATAFLLQRSDASQEVKTAGWIGAATLPIAVGFYRIKAGRHFPTDVLAGFTFGALVGWAVPYFHRDDTP
jgi:membrane-associated phospholipid phosphatase